MSKSVNVKEALRLIALGEYTSDRLVIFEGEERIEALVAATLGEAGIDVPEALIYYDDESIIDDEEFSGPWKTIENDLQEESKYLQLELKIDPEIQQWLIAKHIDVTRLVEKLINDTYRTEKLIQ